MHFTQSAQERGLPSVPVLVGYLWSPVPRGQGRCQQHRGMAWHSGWHHRGQRCKGRTSSAWQQELRSLYITTCSHPEQHRCCPLLLGSLLCAHPKTSFCPSPSQTRSVDLTTEADNCVTLPTSLAPRRERIYSAQSQGFLLELCFSACNHSS